MSWRARPAGASREADRSAKPPHIAGLGPRRARRAYEKEGSIRMDFQFLTLERRDGVATITLNRPDAFNALSLGLVRELFREALEWGLVTRVVPDAELGTAVTTLARELANGPSKAYGGAKRLFHQSTWESLETQMELEAQAIAASGHTEDFRSGVTAFARKQTPTFRGR